MLQVTLWFQEITSKKFLMYEQNLQTYCLIKDCYTVEHYVKYHLDKRQWSVCVQLRSGRFSVTLEEDGLSWFREPGATENEVHLLFFCSVYDDVRDVRFIEMSSI